MLKSKTNTQPVISIEELGNEFDAVLARFKRTLEPRAYEYGFPNLRLDPSSSSKHILLTVAVRFTARRLTENFQNQFNQYWSEIRGDAVQVMIVTRANQRSAVVDPEASYPLTKSVKEETPVESQPEEKVPQYSAPTPPKAKVTEDEYQDALRKAGANVVNSSNLHTSTTERKTSRDFGLKKFSELEQWSDEDDKLLNRIRLDGDKIKVAHIRQKVASDHNMEMAHMEADGRSHKIVKIRRIAMYLASLITDKDDTSVGRAFGGFNNSDVILAKKKVRSLIKTELEVGMYIQYVLNFFEKIRANLRDCASTQVKVATGESLSGTLEATDIIAKVAEDFGLKKAQLMKPDGTPRLPNEIVNARRVAMYLVKNILGHDYEQIAEDFGGFQKSTARQAFAEVQAELAIDSELQKYIHGVTSK